MGAFRTQKTSILVVAITVIAIFVAYAVLRHWIVDGFIAACSLVFEGFSVRVGVTIIPDIVLLLITASSLYGAYSFIKNFAAAAITLAILMGLGFWAISALSEDQPTKPIKISSFPKLDERRW